MQAPLAALLHKENLSDMTFHAVVLGAADLVALRNDAAELAGLLAPRGALWVRGVMRDEQSAAWTGEGVSHWRAPTQAVEGGRTAVS